jgi:membrane fusion protein, multidrug efflux system
MIKGVCSPAAYARAGCGARRQPTNIAVLLVLLLIGAAACTRTEATPDSERSRPDADAVPVVAALAEVKTMPVTIDAVGTVEAISTVEIRSQVTGQLLEILFTPGQEVRKGQPLFRLDSRPFEAALRQAEAVVARDTAQANAAVAQRSRFENLFNRGLIPRDQYEMQTASADALQATLTADKAQAEQARLNLLYTKIAAPIDGRTGALLAHAGDLVRANDTDPLVTINQLSPIYVTFSVPARLLVDIRRYESRAPLPVMARGQAATRGQADEAAPGDPPASAGPTAAGTITFIDNAVDAATATIRLKATFPNRDRNLWPGLFVQVALRLSTQPNAVVVPAIAVQASQQGQYVYVVKPDRTVEMRKVTVERQQGDEAIIARGLNGDEEVVTEGQLRLAPGARVTIAGNEGVSS